MKRQLCYPNIQKDPLSMIRQRTIYYLRQYYLHNVPEQPQVFDYMRLLLLKDETVCHILNMMIQREVSILYFQGRTWKLTQNIENKFIVKKVKELLTTIIRSEYRLFKRQIQLIIIEDQQQIQHKMPTNIANLKSDQKHGQIQREDLCRIKRSQEISNVLKPRPNPTRVCQREGLKVDRGVQAGKVSAAGQS